MNISIITAGGSGVRMGANIPKQFIVLSGKPVIIHTLECFQKHKDIDVIIVCCIVSYIGLLSQHLKEFGITKAIAVSAGPTGQQSIFAGLRYAYDHYPSDSIVLIHDAVRPFINQSTISDNIEGVRRYGNAITCSPATETVLCKNLDGTVYVPERDCCLLARAPQSFVLKDLYKAHLCAMEDNNYGFKDSLGIMSCYSKQRPNLIVGPVNNIKITTQEDLLYSEYILNKNER